MFLPQGRLKNDPDRRMDNVAAMAQARFPEKDLQALNHKNFEFWIEELRAGETSIRRLRKRLEALHTKVEKQCPACGRPVVGRSDAIYCNSKCRLRAHRMAKKARE